MWPGGTQAHIANPTVKWCMHAKFHVSTCKSLSFAGKDVLSEIFDFNCAILGSLGFISLTAEIDLEFCKGREGGGGGGG